MSTSGISIAFCCRNRFCGIRLGFPGRPKSKIWIKFFLAIYIHGWIELVELIKKMYFFNFSKIFLVTESRKYVKGARTQNSGKSFFCQYIYIHGWIELVELIRKIYFLIFSKIFLVTENRKSVKRGESRIWKNVFLAIYIHGWIELVELIKKIYFLNF